VEDFSVGAKMSLPTMTIKKMNTAANAIIRVTFVFRKTLTIV
jgi:hypothetical protein